MAWKWVLAAFVVIALAVLGWWSMKDLHKPCACLQKTPDHVVM